MCPRQKRCRGERQFRAFWGTTVVEGEQQLTWRLDVLLAWRRARDLDSEPVKQTVAELNLPFEGMLATNRSQCTEEFAGDVSGKSKRSFRILQTRPLYLSWGALARQLGEAAGDEMVVQSRGHYSRLGSARSSRRSCEHMVVNSAEEDVLVVPAEKRRRWAQFWSGRQPDLLAMQCVVVPPVLELFTDARTHFETCLWSHRDVAAVEQRVEVTSKQEAIVHSVRPACGKWVNVSSLEHRQSSLACRGTASSIRV